MARVPPDDPLGKRQWDRITKTVKPLHPLPPEPPPAEVTPSPARRTSRAPKPAPAAPPPAAPARQPAPSARTLDRHWDRMLKAGRIDPDMVVDLHGHSLGSAHAELSRRIEQGVNCGARVMLVIAGKLRGVDQAPRGAIRRELDDWLAHGWHAGRIAAVRNAHPRHGGDGAVYVIFRRSDRAR